MDQFPSALAAASLVDGQHFTLPGYGTLKGVYVSAQINHVAREVAPPRLEVTWETTPVPGGPTFAELLVNTGATNAEAIDAQDAWLDAIERGERVEVGDLGGLVLDSTTSLVRWMPNREALNRAYWSGGAVPVEPLSGKAGIESDANPVGSSAGLQSTEPTPVTASAKTSAAEAGLDATSEPVLHTSEDSSSTKKLLRYAALFAGVFLAITLLYNVFSGDETQEEDAKAVTISNDRLNRSPLDGAGAEAGVLDDDYRAPDYNADLGPGGDGGFDPADLAGATPPSTSRGAVSTAPRSGTSRATRDANGGEYDRSTGAGARAGEHVVILGSFGNARNANRFEQRLLSAGQLPYLDQYNGLTRVGVTVTTTGRRGELTDALARLRREYNQKAWILE